MMEQRLLEIFEHLHSHPEPSWQEVNTTVYLAEQLRAVGLEPITFDDMTGIYVDIGEGTPRVGFRTDIDSLWQEVDGEFKANHSCGHDGHMTMALGVAFELQKRDFKARFVFYSSQQKKKQQEPKPSWKKE